LSKNRYNRTSCAVFYFCEAKNILSRVEGLPCYTVDMNKEQLISELKKDGYLKSPEVMAAFEANASDLARVTGN